VDNDEIEGTARSVFGERAAFYAASPAHADPRVLERLVARARPEPSELALDIATGAGHTALALAPHVAFVLAADLTPAMLHQVHRLADDRNVAHVRPILADAHALPVPDKAFDIVTCRRAAHHFSGIERALQEMRRVLRPDGRCVIDDRSVPEDDAVDRTMDALDRLHDPSHVRQYRISEWRRMLERAGLPIDEVEAYTQHRPLASLTDGVSRDGVTAIHRILDGLDSATRAALDLREVDGVIHLNHWYVMITARAAPEV